MSNYDLNLKNLKLPEIIRHKDKGYFLCSVRQKPIQSKPEENLRQQIVTYLAETLGYPTSYIDVEVPMSYFSQRKKGRADIIVYDRQFTDPDRKPFIIIECKAPDNNKILDDYRYHKQVNDYDKLVNAKIIMLTNGYEFFIKEKDSGKQLKRLPSFAEVKKSKAYKFIETKEYSWKRTSFKNRFDTKLHSSFIKDNFISQSTDKVVLPYIIHLMDLFYDDKTILPAQRLGSFEIVKDCGLRPANYGYAFGAGLIGNYRFFLLKQKDGNHRIVSYSIYHQNDWGTYLMIAVDDRQGHSLELRLDRYIKTSDTVLYDIWHNGSLTVGKKGRLKNLEVVEYLKDNAPFLVKGSNVALGTLDLSKDLSFEQSEVKEFILRTATYAILREEIRQLRK